MEQSNIGQQTPQSWGNQQQQQALSPSSQHSQQQPSQQTPASNMSGPVPPLMSPNQIPNMSPIVTMSPMQQSLGAASSNYANPSSPWFSAQHQYQQHINARRNDQMDFRYNQQPAPGAGQHPGPVQPPMNVAPPHGQHQLPPPASQQQTPHAASQQQPASATPAPVSTPVAQRSRKRPNPATAQAATTSASPVVPPIPSATPSTGASTTAVPPPTTPGAPTTSATPTSAATPNASASASNPVKTQPDESGSNSTPPPAKKSRTNTPWTPAEEHRLKQMRDAGNSWAEISKTFPTRTEGSVKKHWYKDMHYAEFAEDESVALLNAIKEYESQKWRVIGQKVGKPAKACEQYAKEHFTEQGTLLSGKR